MRGASAIALLCLSGCSFTVASSGAFTECNADADCPSGKVCSQHYCLPNQVPDGCRGERNLGPVDDANAIPFGAALPITPPDGVDQSEIAGLNAIGLALDEVNQRAVSLGGKQISLRVCDTAADSQKARAQADWLTGVKGALAVITSGSGQTIAASSVTIPRQVVLISATSTSPELTSLAATSNGSPRLVWRTAPSDAIQGKVMASEIATNALYASVARIGIIYLSDPYGQGLKEVLQSQIPTTRPVQSFIYTRGGDITQAVNGLNAFDPDLTVTIAYPDDADRIVKYALSLSGSNLTRAQGHRWLFSDSAKDPALMSGLGAQASEIDGSLGTSAAQGAGLAYQSFHDTYVSRYGIDPASYSYTPNSYDLMYVLGLGVAWAAKGGTATVTGAGIADGLTHLSSGTSYRLSPAQFTAAAADLAAGKSINIDGTSGPLDFDSQTGEAPAPIEVWQVQGSGFVTVKRVNP